MIKVEKIDIWGFEHAIRGMRNALNSWSKSDSSWGCNETTKDEFCPDVCLRKCKDAVYLIGENDMELMRKLCKAGSTHRKFMRQIMVSMDITAPLYWWSEYDTYKVGTTANSCSKMHTLHKRDVYPDDFSTERLFGESYHMFAETLKTINAKRREYLDTGNKDYWYQMIQLLPQSYNQKRTVTMSYENILTIIEQRTGHKLDEWKDFVAVLRGLPYMNELLEGIEVHHKMNGGKNK